MFPWFNAIIIKINQNIAVLSPWRIFLKSGGGGKVCDTHLLLLDQNHANVKENNACLIAIKPTKG